MTETLDDILDDLFHGCALAAYVELAIAGGGPPDEAATRRLAYRYYEEALAANQPAPPRDQSLVPLPHGGDP